MFLSLSLTERSKRLNPPTEHIDSPTDDPTPSTSSSSSSSGRPVGSRFTAPLLHQSLSKTRRPFWSSCTLQPNEVSHDRIDTLTVCYSKCCAHHTLHILYHIMHHTLILNLIYHQNNFNVQTKRLYISGFTFNRNQTLYMTAKVTQMNGHC